MNVHTIVSLDKALRAMCRENMGNTGDLTRWADYQIAMVGVQEGYQVQEDLMFRPSFAGRPTKLPLLTTKQAAENVLGEWDDAFSAPGTTVGKILEIRNKWADRVGLPARKLIHYN